jgi:hypothetical protein
MFCKRKSIRQEVGLVVARKNTCRDRRTSGSTPCNGVYTLLWRLNAPFKTICKFEDSILLRQQKRIAKQISNGSNGFLMDSLSNGIAYVKMKTLCLHISDSKCAWTLRFPTNMFCLGQKHQSFIKFSNFDNGICNATIQHTI